MRKLRTRLLPALCAAVAIAATMATGESLAAEPAAGELAPMGHDLDMEATFVLP